MPKLMLIDTSHKEETRVAVLSEDRLEEFDFESNSKKNLRGNVYLAKITRVEPSLQAAFVDYGGNRHGFLAFSEIHPDYYRIPVADREALEEEIRQMETEKHSEDLADESEELETGKSDKKTNDKAEKKADLDFEVEIIGDEGAKSSDTPGSSDTENAEEEKAKTIPLYKRYKIQEVIEKNQIVLIQVSKEERANKGAALTTYMSIAGRYCVLMPNSRHGGGVSHKIESIKERKKLRTILDSIETPEGMSLIVRTAGRGHTKAEIKRDSDYLMRTWDKIRELTLSSVAPSLVHEEGNLLKKSLRDLYSKDFEEVLVQGEDGYKQAKDLMKAMVPSHVKRVKKYEDTKPLFQRYQIEEQIDSMHQPEAPLPSGGSLVINPTEALTAIDINSGRSTRERHISDTAYRTNLEAATEIARQLKLRDLAGLIVIDFIDMDKTSHIHAVEKRLKEALSIDRARIQVGRISTFGLLEMSRQRMRPSLLEASAQTCPHCHGTGLSRSNESLALQIIRTLEKAKRTPDCEKITLKASTPVALYILNQKRALLDELEARFSCPLLIEVNPAFSTIEFEIDGILKEQPKKLKKPSRNRRRSSKQRIDGPQERGTENPKDSEEKSEKNKETLEEKKDNKSESSDQPRRRRRRGGGSRRHQGQDSTPETKEKESSEKAEVIKIEGP
ncbi:MAG: ribonuclease E/G, partial [bacterium]|nr:ribonuclease E/G [bacterium]